MPFPWSRGRQSQTGGTCDGIGQSKDSGCGPFFEENKALGLCGFHCLKNVGNSKKQFAWPHVFSLGELSPHLYPTIKDRGSCKCLFSPSVSVSGRILDLKTGTVKKEGQQSSMRMCMGSRRSFICRMRSVWGSSGLGLWWGYSLPPCCWASWGALRSPWWCHLVMSPPDCSPMSPPSWFVSPVNGDEELAVGHRILEFMGELEAENIELRVDISEIGKDPDVGKDWGQEEKGATKGEIVGWHHRLLGYDFEQTPRDGEGQGSLAVTENSVHQGQNASVNVVQHSKGFPQCFGQ